MRFKKRLLNNGVSSLELGYVASVGSLAILLPFATYQFIEKDFHITWELATIILGLGIIELFGLWTYLEALSETDLSIASPLKKLKPISVALFEPIVFATVLDPLVVVGAICTAIGAYIVLLERENILKPFKRLKNRGVQLAFLAAFIYTILALGSRFGNTQMPPSVFGVLILFPMAIGFRVFLKNKTEKSIQTTDYLSGIFVIIVFVAVFRSVTVWIAYGLADATKVSTITQLTVLIDVFVGGVLFKEENLYLKVSGAILILGGVILVAIS